MQRIDVEDAHADLTRERERERVSRAREEATMEQRSLELLVEDF